MSELPIELQAVIAAGLGYLVTEGLKSLSALLGRDLSGAAAGITAALSSAVILFAGSLLSAVPAEYAQVIQPALMLLVAVLGAFGIHRQVKRHSAEYVALTAHIEDFVK